MSYAMDMAVFFFLGGKVFLFLGGGEKKDWVGKSKGGAAAGISQIEWG